MIDTPGFGPSSDQPAELRTDPASADVPAPAVVGIGASAGGLAAFIAFLQHMPPASGLAFVLVQHLDPQHPSLLPELLASHTAMPVCQVVDQTRVAANHVYLIAPNTALTIARGVLRLEPPTAAHGQRLQIDHFFHSLAADQGARAVGIVLSGTGADGSAGLAAIQARGGLTLAQTPASAAYPSMPEQAIAHGVADQILEVAAMPAALLARAPLAPPTRAPEASDGEEAPVIAAITDTRQQATGHDLGTQTGSAPAAPDDGLAQELQRTRDTLEATIGELQAANLDLTAVNEELRSLNEELQAANEELQTSKEEIQSINEELQTVNAELSRKIEELDRANADLSNLFASAQIPAIFLHADGRIARFTPQATELFALIDTDLGRPLSDLTAYFSDGDLRPLLVKALQSPELVELMVHQPEHDRWWTIQIRPYRTLTGVVDGVVLTFADITTLKRAETVLQEAHDELERRVAARTQDLALANEALRAQVSERVKSEQARQQLLQQLVTAQEEERRHLARELHDQLGQELTALILGLKALQDTGALDSRFVERLAQLQALAVGIGQEVRSMAVKLRPSVLDDLGLSLALSNYVEQWSARAHVAADLHMSGLEGERLPLAMETTLYRLIQEALNNVLKHAQASEVSVIIERNADEVRLIIEDDGDGFSMPLPRNPELTQQLGLIGMRERVTLLNGTLTIESAPGSGTTIFARIPLPRIQQGEPDGNG